jgi:hypothetical protein
MAEKDIYGQVPDLKGDAKSALSDAMSDLAESNSNTINGSLKSKDVEYDPENGK